ncbi:aldolase catalytic domain-containing protein [Diplocloster agilis]|uniref:aldolase catalytic domain-containing protein n=1 Tax=Diplocloster agilis TaxID=2850323 RepID=UPI000822C543|nr:aldolase catalytic domain-containing protein [Suonthocola fibrivorans]MCU6733119.1 aldolase catalytic domain-containing protein [Suonthocola fibrivorans]SCI76024.1 4-hydroxy-2-oxovalerate aldolase 4 [uncultured Clostridium sp.]
MNSLKVLDVTLRDGGCVNDFNFGQIYMEKILAAQEASGVDIIEMGYIDERKGSSFGRTQYINEQVISQCILKQKKPGVVYVAMMDYGKFDIDQLKPRTANSIDGIRMAFHKKDRLDMIPLGKKIMEKGYEFYIQPMVTLRYSDAELLELIHTVNQELPNASGFYIVDSFGEMRPNDMNRMLHLVDHNLISSMTLGFHSHNNLQMSYSNAVALLQFPTNRNLMLDSSIMGMGKGAGNLNTELLLEHLNLYYGKHYRISPLLEVIDKVINQIRSEFYWGYAVEYYLSSANHCTPSYASCFYNKHMLPIDQVGELLGLIAEDKKNSFDSGYAEELYRQYNESKAVDDTATVKELNAILTGKQVLLVAPGKSICSAKSEIDAYVSKEEIVSIGLNLTSDMGLDYLLTTRKDVYDSAVFDGKSVIVTSNVSKGGRGNVKVLNYKNWIDIDERTHDSSAVIALKLVSACGVKEVLLAGFDGFSVNINDNYYDPNMRFPVNEEQAERRNRYYKQFIDRVRKNGMKVRFLTHSKYE